MQEQDALFARRFDDLDAVGIVERADLLLVDESGEEHFGVWILLRCACPYNRQEDENGEKEEMHADEKGWKVI